MNVQAFITTISAFGGASWVCHFSAGLDEVTLPQPGVMVIGTAKGNACFCFS